MIAYEEWAVVPGFGNRYEISNLGRIRSHANARHGNREKTVILKQKKNTAGYFQVNLYIPGGNGKQHYKMIHRLVAEAFVANPHCFPVVNHRDGNKLNNISNNLEWVTYSENSFHAVRNGFSKPSQRQKEVTSKRCSIPVIMCDKCMNEIARFDSAKQASMKTGTDISAIIKCCRGKLKTTKGYKWKYADRGGIGSTGRI